MQRSYAALILVGTLSGAIVAAACGENGQAESLDKTPSVVTVELPAVSVVTAIPETAIPTTQLSTHHIHRHDRVNCRVPIK